MMNSVEQRFQRANNVVSSCMGTAPIPVLVHIVRGLLRADELGDLRPLIAAIKMEPTITARIIAHVSQSPIYPVTSPVLSVENAINIMGLLQTKRVILPITMAATFDHSQCEAFDLKRHMTTAICVGYGAANIGGALFENENSSPLPVMRAADWYTIGFLHNIGLLLMVECNPQITDEALSAPDFIDMSQTLLGVNHFDLGAALLKNWGLPAPFYVPLPHIRDSLYRGEYWQISAVLGIARMYTSPDSSDADIAAMTEEWGIVLPPEVLEDDKDEALNLINMVL